MEPVQSPSSEAVWAPVAQAERIQVLDVVRGFALLGIFLMNIEYFNRPMGEMGLGLPSGLSGADWWASRLIYLLVQGKFWTLFSLLFGMGFAVMLTRAEAAGRPFLGPYLRRIAALATFGLVHYIFLWRGDILFSYAIGALALLVLLYGRAKPILLALPVLVGLGFIPKAGLFWGAAGSLALVGVVALHLRHEKTWSLAGGQVPPVSAVLTLLGLLGALASAGLWLWPKAPFEPRVILPVLSGILLSAGLAWTKWRNPPEQRLRRLGLALYLLPCVAGIAFGVIQRVGPSWADYARTQARARVEAQTRAAAKPGVAKDAGPAKTEAQFLAELEAERQKRIQDRLAENREERDTLAKGRYAATVRFRARKFLGQVGEEMGGTVVFLGMFLLGAWFVRSGVMARAKEHLPLFRKLAWMALPLGLGLGLASMAIGTSHTPGADRDGWQLATMLMTTAALPMSLGYLGLLVLGLHRPGGGSLLRLLAPAGRMALTNYLAQSLVSTTVFCGYGLGLWGLGRARQVVFVVAVYALQVAFSAWWLARFQYGPMEWLWRAITYWKRPALRAQATIAAPVPEPAPTA